jgi:hypothetical protein
MPVSRNQGVVHGGSVILDKEAQFVDGTRVVVMPLNEIRGTPAAILAALAHAPPVNPKDVDELECLIEAGKRPFSKSNPLSPKRRGKKT